MIFGKKINPVFKVALVTADDINSSDSCLGMTSLDGHILSQIK